jgi:IPT/TIG domain
MIQITPVSINEPPDPANLMPSIGSISPAHCTIGDPDFTLYLTGEGFNEHSVIFFAGHDEPTTLNEDGTLSTGVKPSLWQEPVVVQCQVKNGPLISNSVGFAFDAPAMKDTDPDDIEDEIEQEIEEGDIEVHRGKPTRTLPRNRKK